MMEMMEPSESELLQRAAGETDQCPEEMVAEEFEREQARLAVSTNERRSHRHHDGAPPPPPPPPPKEEEEDSDSDSEITIQNVVATANLRIAIDLKKLTLSARNAEYNPKKFSAVIMRIRNPRCTSLIFSTGKMVCTGAKSEREARLGARKFAAIIRKIGYAPRFTDFVVQNMVATADVGFPVRLESLVYAHAKFSSYEPELFPGCIYRLVVPKTVLLLFVSGRVVITGAKSSRQLRTAFDKIYPVLCDYRKDTLPLTTLLLEKPGLNDDDAPAPSSSSPSSSSTDLVVAPDSAEEKDAADRSSTGGRRLAGAPRIGRSGRRANNAGGRPIFSPHDHRASSSS